MSKETIGNVLMFSNWYPNRNDPFPGDFVQRHAKAISRYNKVKVIHFVPDDLKKTEIEETIINPNLIEKTFYFPKSKYGWIHFIKKSIHVWNAVKDENYDLVHLNVMYYHYWPLLFLKKPLVITEHFSGFLPENIHSIPILKSFLVQKLLKKASAVSTVSHKLSQGLKSLYPAAIDVIPNVVDTSVFFVKPKTKSEITRFLHVSNLSEVKNIPIILEAIKILAAKRKDFIFKIGGNGDTRLIQDFRTQNNLDDLIEVIEEKTYEEVAGLMQEADAFVLYSKYENQPCVIIESFATGTPAISSDVGGISENFPEEFGILIEPNKAEILAEAMNRFMDNYEIAEPEQISNYAKNNFSKEIIGAKFNSLYQNALKHA